MLSDQAFTKENLNHYLKELAKEFRKRNGKTIPAEDILIFIENAFTNGNYEVFYQRVRQLESENRDILLEFQGEYPGVTNDDNVDDIIKMIRKKKEG